MKKYHVTVAFRTLEVYAVEAPDRKTAADWWAEGDLIDTDDEALDSTVLRVKEV